ncbi:M23 family metallopeptidase [Streptacidiphilus sp. NEAU-YB345]|uniref:M23 family metallopeptidase n=2 Tax=Streptacidiphilus fuscans TaxID=2789292 RepID=A0A931B193_9ACTN|nr:M23 family metallopeptidase [Streptacidiphilus fuscans]
MRRPEWTVPLSMSLSMPVSVPLAGATVAPAPVTGWFSPAPGAAISQPFGVPDPEYAAGYHTGVDFAVFTGTPLFAVADATVVTAGWGGAYGNWIVLRLPDGFYALYAHMSRLDVRTGDHVAGGQQIGLSGESGNARGPHLHFEIRPRNVYGAVIDPLPYLRAHGCHV